MEQGRIQQKRSRGSVYICVALLVLLFFALLLRVPYGFDWTDEAYYTALPYRLALGDRLLIDTWEVHQLSGLIALPFLQAFRLFSGGSMAGVMLYFRYVLAVAQFAVSLYAFFVLRRKSGDAAAFLSAGMVLMHVHYGLNGFSYNALTPLLTVLSALLVFDASDGKRTVCKAALGGISYALAVQAYPYFALSLPVYAVFLLRNAARSKAEGKKSRIPPAFAIGVGAVILAFAAAVLLQARGGDVLAGVRGMLGDPDHAGESVPLVLAQYANALRVLFGPVAVGAVLLLVWSVAACYWKRPAQRARMRSVGAWGCVLLALGAVVWVALYDYPNPYKINLAAASLALLAPALYFLSGRKADRAMLLFFLGCALSVGVQLGSNTRIRSSAGMLLPASVGALLYLFDHMDGTLASGRARRIFRVAAAAVCAGQLLLTAGLRIVTVYRDAPLGALDTAIVDGPARGIVTTGENAEDYAAVYADLTEHAPKQGYLLVTNLLPVAYLMTGLRPAAPSTFNMTLDSEWLARYYENNPGRVPDCVFAADEDVGASNAVSLAGAEDLAARTGRAYERLALPSGTLFLAE